MRISHKLYFSHLHVERSRASPLGETKSLNYQTPHEAFKVLFVVHLQLEFSSNL